MQLAYQSLSFEKEYQGYMAHQRPLCATRPVALCLEAFLYPYLCLALDL